MDKKQIGFTMAEILISLTIIGIIAAITLPALRNNINETTWNAQRKALYSRLSQAISMLPSLNGYGIGATLEETNEKAAQIFITEGLSRVLQVNNICSITNLKKCGIPDKITTITDEATGKTEKINFPENFTDLHPMFTGTYTQGGENFSNPQAYINTDTAAFETKNGESVAVFYNPYCQQNMGETDHYYIQPKMCINFIYDLNGTNGPNKVSKDVGFISVLYPTDSRVVAPIPFARLSTSSGNTFKSTHPKAAASCRAKYENGRVPNIDELSALFYNGRLDGMTTGFYWSATKTDVNHAQTLVFHVGRIDNSEITTEAKKMVRCIKR